MHANMRLKSIKYALNMHLKKTQVIFVFGKKKKIKIWEKNKQNVFIN